MTLKQTLYNGLRTTVFLALGACASTKSISSQPDKKGSQMYAYNKKSVKEIGIIKI